LTFLGAFLTFLDKFAELYANAYISENDPGPTGLLKMLLCFPDCRSSSAVSASHRVHTS